MCLEQEQQEQKPRSKNTKLKSKNQKLKNTNTSPATDLPCQPNTNPATDFSCQPNTKTTNTNPTRNGYEELTIMDFFKSIFSEDSDQPQNDDAPELNLDLNPNPDSDSDSTAIWSFDRLIKTIASKSKSVIQTYRHNIENSGPG